ncbi:MAG: 16S rRNA (cytidine(1402)-2'-O)-methyltransferase [Synergistaceae bacterium]|jgi:16S rRNA (cytidine1402-2'-O)-methyltransferase|nr:16S rRNA (cytidine(1402)-2'-O)-methyltransferase [Synergistaceae bacterium]
MPLVLVPTPIGNMGDITLRGLEALKNADAIACEDTRRTLKLLNFYGIRKPLFSYHRHNERARAEEIIGRLERGESIALVSDAGTPGISDPGGVLIEKAISRGLEIDALPGANAVLPALLMSGISAEKFYFRGFVEGSGSEVESAMRGLSGIDATLVFYVAPHDISRFLASAVRALGDRRAAVVREISKLHQEALRGTLCELAASCGQRDLKGEMSLVVEGSNGEAEGGAPEPDWEKLARNMKKSGIFDKEIANALFASYGISRNRVKTFLMREETK